MKKLLLSIVSTLLFAHFVSAQVGIGTEVPSSSAQLEVASKDRGILIPRVALLSSTDQATVNSRGQYENSLLVFNTNNAADVTAGYYYWYETKWHRITTTTETANLEETITTLNEEEPGVFVYTSESGIKTTIDIPDAVVENIINEGDILKTLITELTQNEEFINNVINKLAGDYGNVSFDSTTNTFYFLDEDGNQVAIDWKDFNTVNETFAVVGDDLVITDSEGNSVSLALKEIAANETFVTEIANNDKFVTELTNNENFITELTENLDFIENIINNLTGDYGNVSFDSTTNTFYFLDEDGNQVAIDWKDFNTVNETFAVVGDDLVITDSEGNAVQVALVDIASNETFVTHVANHEKFVTELVNNDSFITELTENLDFIENIINNLTGDYGNVSFDSTTNTFYFLDEDGNQVAIDWEDFNTVNETFAVVGDDLVITDSEGNAVQVALVDIASNETFVTHVANHEKFVTELVNNDSFITELTENLDFIENIINNLTGDYGNVSFDSTTNTFYFLDEDGNQVAIDWEDFNTVNETFAVVGDDLVITDSEGNAVQVALVDIASNETFVTHVANHEKFVTELVNNDSFITELTENLDFIENIINNLTGDYGNVSFDSTTNTFYFLDEDGNQVAIDWEDFNTVNETFAVVGDDLVITDSEGNAVQVALVDIASNETFVTHVANHEKFVTELVNNDSFITELTENLDFIENIINNLTGDYGNVSFDSTTNTFYFLDEDGNQVAIDWEDFNTVNETFAVVGDDLVITDSEGNAVQVALVDIASNETFVTHVANHEKFVTELVNNENFITELTENLDFIENIINNLTGDYGNVSFDSTTNTFYFLDEDGNQVAIDWEDFNTVNETFAVVGDDLVITDSEGNAVQVALVDIASNETFVTHVANHEKFVTELVNNENFITELTENLDFIENIINNLTGDYGNVSFDSTTNTFYFLDEDGNQVAIDWEDFNTVNETFAVVGDDLVITDSEGNAVQVALVDIASNETFVTHVANHEKFVTELVNNENFITELSENLEFIENIINNLTGEYGNVSFDSTTNTFYYLDEAGDQVAIDWKDFNTVNESFAVVGDDLVITDSEGNAVQVALVDIAANDTFVTHVANHEKFVTELVNNENFITELSENLDFIENIINNLTGEYGNVSFDSTTNTFYYLDEAGDQVAIDWKDFNTVNESFAVVGDDLVITDSEGNAVQVALVDIAANDTFVTHVANHEKFVTELVNNENFITELSENLDFIENIINNLTGEYGNVSFDSTTNTFYYLNEAGDQVAIDWKDFNTVNESFAVVGDDLVITDSEGNAVQVALVDIAANDTFVTHVANNETFVTELTKNEDFITHIINQLADNYGNVGYDVDLKEFYYLNEAGERVTIELETLNTVNETFTIVEDALVITDSEGGTVSIALAEIAANETFVTEIANNEKFVTELTKNEDFITNIINQLADNYGNVGYDVDLKEFYYLNEAGEQVTIELETLNTVNETFTIVEDALVITDSDGGTVSIALAEIAANETFVTEIANNEKFVTELTKNEDFITNIINQLADNYGNVGYDVDLKEFYYLNEAGEQVTIELETLNTVNETFTIVEDALVITDSDGGTVSIALADIAANESFVTEITKNETFIEEIKKLITTSTVDVKLEDKGDGKISLVDGEGILIGTAVDKASLLDKSLENGTYEFSNNNGPAIIIDIPNTVVNNMNEIINKEVTIGDVVYNTFEEYLESIVKESETLTTLEELEGVYTYTNEIGDEFTFSTNAKDLAYDNTDSELEAVNVQDAIDETNTKLDELESGMNVTYNKDEIINTGDTWIDGTSVYQYTAEVSLETPTNTFALAGDVAEDAMVIGMRFISTTTNSISTNVLEYQNASKTLILGTNGSLTVMHPAGTYILILEYASEAQTLTP